MTKNLSAIVIGGGHNGLVCATYLASSGVKTTLLEARETLGGGLSKQTLRDGTAVPGLIQTHHSLNDKIARELKLQSTPCEPLPTTLLSTSGEHITLMGDKVSGAGVSAQDISEYKSFREEYLSYAKALKSLMLNTPPRLKHFDWSDKTVFAKLGLDLRFGLGKAGLNEFLRVAGMNLFDVLEERFSSELLKGGIAADALFGNHAGPKTPTTVLPMLMRLFQETGSTASRQVAQVDNLAGQLAEAAKSAGVEIKTSTTVQSVVMDNDEPTGVMLESGEALNADIIVSNADAKTTFLKLVGARNLDGMFTHRVSKTRTNGDVAKFFATFDATPKFTNLSQNASSGRFLVAPTLMYVERAFNHCKYGEFSEAPVLDIHLTTLDNGKSLLSANAMYTPYNLKQGWEAGRAAFEDKILDILSLYAPGIASQVACRELWSPTDIEKSFHIEGGHWHHGEMAIDQSFMMRPVPGAGQYGTPVPGLYLCGAAAHPGGDITGLPGRNAAKQILADLKGRR